MKKLFTVFSCLIGILIGFDSHSQRMVNGVVTSEEGDPLPGVSIVLKSNPSTGTISDIDGTYSMDVADENAVLVFSFIGFRTSEVTLGGRTTIDVALSEDVQSLDEVLVIAYGETEKRKYTGSLTAITDKEIAQIPQASPVSMLQGRSAGVLIEDGSGAPGSIGNVVIRGVSTFGDNTGPLFVIDGTPAENLNTINPNDIESISVLKDGTATSLYGSRAAFGVVLVTTKTGRPQETEFTINTQYGFSDMENPNGFRMMDAQEYTAYYREAYLRMGGNPDDPSTGFYTPLDPEVNTNWIDAVTQTGTTQLHEISATGGNEKVKHFTSLSYFDQEGVVKQTRFQRYTGRVNLTFAPTARLQVDLNLLGSYVEEDLQFNDGGRSGIFSGAFNIAPTSSPFAGPNDLNGLGYNFSLPSNAGHNPIASLAMNSNTRSRVTIFPTLRLTYEPVDRLIFRTTGSINHRSIKRNLFQSKFYLAETDNGRAELENDIIDDVNFNISASYDYNIDSKHSLTPSIGFELYHNQAIEEEFESRDFAFDGINNVAAGGTQLAPGYSQSANSLVSVFSRLNYAYADKLFLDASYRRDGSSRFGPDNRWGDFYALGIGYRLIEEPFLQSQNLLSDLKVRASYGVVGSNNNIGNFDWRQTYNGEGQFIVPIQNSDSTVTNTGAQPESPGNQRLKWETSRKLNFGIDFGFIQNRVTGTVEYYHNRTNDLVGTRVISQTSGFYDGGENASVIVDNIGEIENSGVEITLSTVNVQSGGFRWLSTFNIAFNNNEIVKLNTSNESDTAAFARTVQIVGQPLGQWYLPQYAGVDIASGSSLYFTETGELTFDVNNALRTVNGNTALNPDYFGAVGNTFSYQGVSLSFLVYFKSGNDVYRANLQDLSVPSGNNQAASNLRRWQQPGDITDVPRADDTGAQFDTSRWLEDGSYIRLRNVDLSYQFPESLSSKWNLSNVRLSARAVNLLTLTKFRGFNPDTGSTETNGDFPLNRTVTFGLSATF